MLDTKRIVNKRAVSTTIINNSIVRQTPTPPMKIRELLEAVNDRLFYQGTEHTKIILDGEYELLAKAGWVGYGSKPGFKSTQFRIEPWKLKDGRRVEAVGWVNFEKIDDDLQALDLTIQPAHRRRGIATEMYKFARELGNTIAPSKLQTHMGRQFWSTRDHSR